MKRHYNNYLHFVSYRLNHLHFFYYILHYHIVYQKYKTKALSDLRIVLDQLIVFHQLVDVFMLLTTMTMAELSKL